MMERDLLVKRLGEDLEGPSDPDEVLEARPSDVYLTGVLWPTRTKVSEEEQESLEGVCVDGKGSDDDSSFPEDVPLGNVSRPSAAGVSFAAAADDGSPTISIRVRFGVYERESNITDGDAEPAATDSPAIVDKSKSAWRRTNVDVLLKAESLSDRNSHITLAGAGVPEYLCNKVAVHLRTSEWRHGQIATATLVNRSEIGKSDGRDEAERHTLFQTSLEIRPNSGTRLIARPSRRAIVDEEDRSAALLFRNAKEFATGHTCSASWDAAAGSEEADFVATTWIPTAFVGATSADGHELFRPLRESGPGRPLSVDWLSKASPEDAVEALASLPEAYGVWLENRREEVDFLPESLQEAARENLQRCDLARARMVAGVERIGRDSACADAFRLANLAMRTQYGWDRERAAKREFEWRPFQLGFVLLCLESVIDRDHSARETMDLLWFPTGGGKTEAYLGLIAFLAFHRRLSSPSDPDAGAGVSTIMRYTLRLLTTQQFTRAASVLLACEAIRRGSVKDIGAPEGKLGTVPFSIGLWVGGGATPNTVKEAADGLAGSSDVSPAQLVHCPDCGQRLEWSILGSNEAVQVHCVTADCSLHYGDVPLPVWTVDDDVYRERPTLLIGTIDKFAQIVRKPQVGVLFSVGTERVPDLILQDELHLISGPLGTIAGLYEIAIDRLCSFDGRRPKVIGSTATIRRAGEQVKALFDRSAELFPPSGLDADDSGFAVRDTKAPGRLYASVTTAGRSAKFTLQGVAASLLQSGSVVGDDEQARDAYWTLVTYFNSLRELGGALVLMQDDVAATLSQIAKGRAEEVRQPANVEELTSRRTQGEVRDMLEKLGYECADGAALDVVLATNMLSVGVDIPRLGLMLVNGQPKGIAEYIQATSRVGRGSVPGLVVSVLNNAKSRDRSRFEGFGSWHAALYRDVEPTSVTPFAPMARDKALHAVVVALARHLVPGMDGDNVNLDDDAAEELRSIVVEIVERASRLDPEETQVEEQVERIVADWQKMTLGTYWNDRRPKTSLLISAEEAAKSRARGWCNEVPWPTPNSMRGVEPATYFRLARGLARIGNEGNANG